MTKDKPPLKDSAGPRDGDDRQARLAKALRANLARRKQQARARDAKPPSKNDGR